ncbi:unnamed protein product [Mytilus coruscus]|uniref:Endonuclease/exonuclease/phosphatase domain-containing protein n=1 Tax=Mytilus coruscus TaxID=42192 RepID=A0A6J8DTV7_MYTCO|nr:unnamed protein product [Mytilus coruscus]
MKTNLSIGSWNIQGLGCKLEDDYFLSSLKYDINILMETWKSADSSTNIINFSYVQKSRKKKLRPKRYSGGIIVYYKSTLYKGISEVLNVTKSDNRLWLKLDKFFFGLKKDIYLCACYIPPLTSTYFNDDFILLENEISKMSSKGNILIIGDLNAIVSNHLDFISDENNIHDDLLNLLPDDYLGDSHIYRNSLDKVLNSHGKQLIEICIASRLRILNEKSGYPPPPAHSQVYTQPGQGFSQPGQGFSQPGQGFSHPGQGLSQSAVYNQPNIIPPRNVVAKQAAQRGDMELAHLKAKNARNLVIVAVVVGLLGWAFLVAYILIRIYVF